MHAPQQPNFTMAWTCTHAHVHTLVRVRTHVQVLAARSCACACMCGSSLRVHMCMLMGLVWALTQELGGKRHAIMLQNICNILNTLNL